MGTRTGVLLWGLLGFSFIWSGCTAPGPVLSGPPELQLQPKSARQGQSILVKVLPALGDPLPGSIRLAWAEQTVALWPCPKPQAVALCGLLAVPLDAPVGKATVELVWKEGGQPRELRGDFKVLKGKFKVNRLSVDPSISRPDAKNQERIERERVRIQAEFERSAEEPLWDGPFALPTQGAVTSEFGNQRTYNGELRSTHYGVDLRAGTRTPIYAANAGRVALADSFFVAGNMVLIDHGMGIFSSYSHLSTLEVGRGDRVKKGQKLGNAGATGRVTGPHLHWSARANAVPTDPHRLMDRFNAAFLD